MWLVKLGGSLSYDPCIRPWLEALSTMGGGRVIIVPGGGPFADLVRDAQQHWEFDDEAAHRMALHAMQQNALLLAALCPALMPVESESDMRVVLSRGRTALWLPLAMTLGNPNLETNWNVTSDSIAAWLASHLNAERLILVKSCRLPGAPFDARRPECRRNRRPRLPGVHSRRLLRYRFARQDPDRRPAGPAAGRATDARHEELVLPLSSYETYWRAIFASASCRVNEHSIPRCSALRRGWRITCGAMPFGCYALVRALNCDRAADGVRVDRGHPARNNRGASPIYPGTCFFIWRSSHCWLSWCWQCGQWRWPQECGTSF